MKVHTKTCVRLLALLLLTAGALVPSQAGANGGQVRVEERQVGPYVVSVFTSPTPLLAGNPADVSALVTRLESGAVDEQVTIALLVEPANGSAEPIDATLTAEQATEPDYQAAEFEIPSAGTWTFHLTLDGPAGAGEVSFAAGVEEPAGFGWITTAVLMAAVAAMFILVIAIVRRGGEPDANKESG